MRKDKFSPKTIEDPKMNQMVTSKANRNIKEPTYL